MRMSLRSGLLRAEAPHPQQIIAYTNALRRYPGPLNLCSLPAPLPSLSWIHNRLGIGSSVGQTVGRLCRPYICLFAFLPMRACLSSFLLSSPIPPSATYIYFLRPSFIAVLLTCPHYVFLAFSLSCTSSILPSLHFVSPIVSSHHLLPSLFSNKH